VRRTEWKRDRSEKQNRNPRDKVSARGKMEEIKGGSKEEL